jgi:hypothetical protein
LALVIRRAVMRGTPRNYCVARNVKVELGMRIGAALCAWRREGNTGKQFCAGGEAVRGFLAKFAKCCPVCCPE